MSHLNKMERNSITELKVLSVKREKDKSKSLFTQDWPNLLWGRFNNVEVDSINTYQVAVL